MKEVLKKPLVVGILALVACALWGSAFPGIKIGYKWLQIEDTGSRILFAGYRFFLAGMITFIVGSILEKKILRLDKTAVPYVMGIGMLQTTLQYVFFYIGMANITGVKGSVINSANAFVSIITAHFLLKNEKMSWQKGMGCLIGFVGVIVINYVPGEVLGTGFSFWGEGMIVLCTMIYGISSVLMKMISRYGSAMAITSYQLQFGGVLLIVIGWLSGGKIHHFTMKSLLLLAYLAVLSAVAFSIWTSLLKYNPVSRVTIFGFSIPVFGVILSAIFLNEQVISWKNLVALAFVSGGIIIVNLVPSKS